MLLIAVQMNGPSDDAATAEGTGSANASKPWERVWTVDEMRRTAPNWHLANDVGVSFCFFLNFLFLPAVTQVAVLKLFISQQQHV